MSDWIRQETPQLVTQNKLRIRKDSCSLSHDDVATSPSVKEDANLTYLYDESALPSSLVSSDGGDYEPNLSSPTNITPISSYVNESYTAIINEVTQKLIVDFVADEISNVLCDQTIAETLASDCSAALADRSAIIAKEKRTILSHSREILADYTILNVLLNQIYTDNNGEGILYKTQSERVVEGDMMLCVLLHQRRLIDDYRQPIRSSFPLSNVHESLARKMLQRALMESLALHLKEDMERTMIAESEEQFAGYLDNLKHSTS